MSNEDIKAAVCRDALAVVQGKRHMLHPQLADSTEIQLKWLIEFFEGKNKESARLFDLTFGHYAAREIDPDENELISALNKAFYVADQTKRGLKIDLHVVGYCS